MIGIYDVGGRIVKKDILGSKDEHIELGRRLAKRY